MSDPTAVRRAVAIELTEGAPVPAARAALTDRASDARRGRADAAASRCGTLTACAGNRPRRRHDARAAAWRRDGQGGGNESWP